MRLTVETISRMTAAFYGIDPHMMVAPVAARRFARPRQVAMYLAREITGVSYPEIGRRFGGRDHTTVLHACRRIPELMGTDRDLRIKVPLLRLWIEWTDPAEWNAIQAWSAAMRRRPYVAPVVVPRAEAPKLVEVAPERAPQPSVKDKRGIGYNFGTRVLKKTPRRIWADEGIPVRVVSATRPMGRSIFQHQIHQSARCPETRAVTAPDRVNSPRPAGANLSSVRT